MITTTDIDQIIGSDAVDANNDRIGKVSQVYVDTVTDQPTWASVRTGPFGLSGTLVPLDNGTWDHEQLHVAVQKAQVKDAPRVDPDAEISPEEQERLHRYYGLSTPTDAARGQSGPIGAGQTDLDRPGVDVAGMQDLSGSDADLRTDVAMPDREADAATADDAPVPGLDSAPMQGDPAMQTEGGATGMPIGTQEVGAGIQRQPGGGMRLRRYVVRQETIAAPIDQQDELRMQPGAASSMDDASTGMPMDDQDPSDSGGR